jgi:PTS system cellobiose-specific IIA component/PTS system lactose-specific IIA component
MKMTKEAVLSTAFEIIAAAGNAFDCFYSAILSYKKKDMDTAKKKLEEGKQHLAETHRIQMELIQAEAKEETIPYSLIMVHAQDHLNMAISWKRMAQLLIVDDEE